MFNKIRNWFWWKFILKKNEFHPSLNMNVEAIFNGTTTTEKECKRLYKARKRAHQCEEQFSK